MQVQSLGWEDLLEEEMATHSSILAWEIPGQRSLVGYSPRGSKESDTTKQLHFTIEFKGGLDFAVVVQSLSHVCLEVSYLECQNVKSEGNYPVN